MSAGMLNLSKQFYEHLTPLLVCLLMIRLHFSSSGNHSDVRLLLILIADEEWYGIRVAVEGAPPDQRASPYSPRCSHNFSFSPVTIVGN
ncbi:uncharacterized protein [Periplaneta americana]|uniref:uncharacterized protein isoform X4 n=1 Tax=Periplaneta americana TaxID=6978 RepID=UPI0037E701C2